jgi:hypothetical protein
VCWPNAGFDKIVSATVVDGPDGPGSEPGGMIGVLGKTDGGGDVMLSDGGYRTGGASGKVCCPAAMAAHPRRARLAGAIRMARAPAGGSFGQAE